MRSHSYAHCSVNRGIDGQDRALAIVALRLRLLSLLSARVSVSRVPVRTASFAGVETSASPVAAGTLSRAQDAALGSSSGGRHGHPKRWPALATVV